MILQGTGNPVKAFLLPGTVAFDSCHCCCRAKVPLIVAEHQPNFAICDFMPPLPPLPYHRYIYYAEIFPVKISLLKKVNSRRLGRPGIQIGHLVQWSMADAKDKQAPAQWDDTGIT